MSQTIDQVYRDYRTDKVPASGEHEPDKREIRALLKMIQNSGGQAVTRSTLSALDSVTPPNEDYMGVVLTGAEAGYYYRSGGAWVKGRGFPDSFARLTGVSGTNSITASVEAGVTPGEVQMFVLTPSGTNTEPMFINIAGQGTLPLRDFDGEELEAGFVQAGKPVLLYDNGDDTYRLLVDHRFQVLSQQTIDARDAAETAEQNAETAQVVSEMARDQAQSARDLTLDYRDTSLAARDAAVAAAEASGDVMFFDTKAAANAALSGLSEGQIVEVFVDESEQDRRTRYRVEGGVLVGPKVTLVDIRELEALETVLDTIASRWPPLPPPGLPELPILPLGAVTAGEVAVDLNAAAACRKRNASRYANADEWTGITDQATFDSWLQTRSESFARITTNTTIPLNQSFGLRDTHTSQASAQLVKHLIADGCTVTFKVSAPATDVSGLTYTLDGGGSDVYVATMVSAQFPHRMFRTDQTDAWGEAKQLRKHSSLANLQASASGWFRSGTSLYVKLGGNVESQKAVLAAKWMDTNGLSRIYLQGGILCLEAINGGSIILDGVNVQLADGGTTRQAQIWRHGVTQRWNPTVGVQSNAPFGGLAVDSDCTIFSSERDGLNLSDASVNTGRALIVTANDRFIDNGSVDHNGQNGTYQAISAHGGVDHASYGLRAEATNGPAIQDTCTTGLTDFTWLVGCLSVDPSETLKRGFVMGTGTNGVRYAYLDRCESTGATTDLIAEQYAVVYLNNCELPVISEIGPVSSYNPIA